MKIVHLCLAAFYPDNYSYQENMLPKFHKLQGLDVEVIASTQSFDENGKVCFLDNAGTYKNEYDISVTRLNYKNKNKIWRKLKRYVGVYDAIEKANPDIIFVHGCQFLDIDKVVLYIKKHQSIRVFVDNHADFYNSATNWFSRYILHRIVWKRCANSIEPYTIKFYGVLPVRVDFLKNVYKLPENKCELLVMGADDELVNRAKSTNARIRIRNKYGIDSNDFLVLTGGKIDKRKIQTILLMKAVSKINNNNLKLLVFGSITQELKPLITELADGDKIKYIGWIQANESYDYFEAADLVVFPCSHSVMWEQVTGQGIPMLVKDWPGTHHVDLGGNVHFLKKDSIDEIKEEIEYLINHPDEYLKMKNVAENEGMKYFSYSNIASKAINAEV